MSHMRELVVLVVASLFLVIVTPSCRCGAGGRCSKQSNCDYGLFCDFDTCKTCEDSSLCQHAAQCVRSDSIGSADDPFHACMATAETCAKHAELCGVKGKCHFRDGKCIPQGDDCARSKDCKVNGMCSVSGEECRPTRAEDCAGSEACTKHHRCRTQGVACVE